jgi:hypothetical protein
MFDFFWGCAVSTLPGVERYYRPIARRPDFWSDGPTPSIGCRKLRRLSPKVSSIWTV